MALNVKVALLICLGFIGGMCWLVNRVAAPLLPAPAPLVARGAVQSPLVAAGSPVQPGSEITEHFAHTSAVSRAATAELVPADPAAFAVHRPVAPPPELPPVLARVGVREDFAAGALTEDDFAAVPDAVQAPLAYAASDDAPPTVPVAVLAADAQILEAELPDEFSREDVVYVAVIEEPRAGGDEPAAQVAQAESLEPPAGRTYRVRAGDSLSRILLREWGVADAQAISALLAVNPKVRDRRNYTIRVGETLIVPTRQAALAHLERTLADAGRRVATAESLRATRSGRVYRVRRNDTLVKIAELELKDPNRWTDIARLNGLKDADKIVPGIELILPEPSRSEI